MSLIWVLGCSTVCPDEDAPNQGPSILDIDHACVGDAMFMQISATDDQGVSDASVAVRDVNGVDAGAWTPIEDFSRASGSTAVFEVEEDLDCNATWELAVKVTDGDGTSATRTVHWPPVEPAPSGVVPSYGPDSGGTVVTIHGGDLGGVTEVWFSNSQATVNRVEDTEVEVVTPAGSGTVDVRLVSGDETATLPSAFTWYPDNTGLYGGIGYSQTIAYSNDWFDIGSPFTSIDWGTFAQFQWVASEPVHETEHYWHHNRKSWSDCDNTSGAVTSTFDSGAYIQLQGDEDIVIAQHGSSNNYWLVEDNIADDAWAGRVFDVYVDGGALPQMTVPNAVRWMPLGDVSWDYTGEHPIVRGEDLVLQWTFTDMPANFEAVYYLHAGSSSNRIGEVQQCVNGTLGESSIAWDTLTAAVDEPSVDRLYVRISFWTDDHLTMPHDGSVFWMRNEYRYWVYMPVVAE